VRSGPTREAPGRVESPGSDATTIEVRPVREAERAAACRRVFDPPGPELAGMVGDAARARALGEALFARGVHPAPHHEVVAAFAGDEGPVGVLVLEAGGAREQTGVGARVVLPLVLRAVPPWRLPGLAWRAWLRSRLEFAIPPDALHVVELHVAPAWRGRGVGGRLLAHAEALARERGVERLVLSTLVTNPARRLYARHGYRVVAERTVLGYRAVAGGSGRVLMEKAVPGPQGAG